MKDGDPGRYFEDFKVGDVYRHGMGRTLTETDNTWFTLLTCNTNEIHFNADYAAHTEFGKPLMNSALTLALVTGLSVPDISRHIVANLGWDKVRLPAPVFAGDTIYAESEVVETRPSKSRPGQGVVHGAFGDLVESGSECSWYVDGGIEVQAQGTVKCLSDLAGHALHGELQSSTLDD